MTKILLIDDERDVRESVAKVLGREGYAVETANDAHQGLELHGSSRFDILITDAVCKYINIGPKQSFPIHKIEKMRSYPQIVLMGFFDNGTIDLWA